MPAKEIHVEIRTVRPDDAVERTGAHHPATALKHRIFVRALLHRHSIDIWHYRIYGNDPVDEEGNPQEGNSFLEISIPRETQEPTTKGGLSVASWYQPLHENGNILSYPATLKDAQGAYAQPDMGPVRLPCPSADLEGCVEDDLGLWWEERLEPLATFSGAVDGTSRTEWVSMGAETGNAQQAQHTHKMNASLDVSISQSLKLFAGLGQAEVEEKVSLSSWGSMSTQETTTDATRGVQLGLEALQPSLAYDFEAVLCVTQDGTWKLAFSADPMTNDSGKITWPARDWCGAGPDPAR